MFILIVDNGYPTKEDTRGIFSLDQAKALKSMGHKVVMVALDLRSIRRKRRLGYRKLSVEGIDVFSVSFPLGKVPAVLSETVSKAAFGSAFKRVVQEYGTPDVIHAHFSDMGAAVSKVCRENGIPMVVTEHSSVLNRERIPQKLLETAVRGYSDADRLIAVSESFAQRLKNNTKLDFSVVPNIVDTEVFSRVYPKKSSCEEGPFSFISVGNLLPWKGFSDLIDAFKEALDAGGRDMRLIIVGKGPEREALEKQAGELSISDKVCFKGQLKRSEIADLFAESDAFVLLSKGETFGVVYIEAMASGLPVIATACGGPDGFVDSTNGILVPVGDREAYVKALLEMAGGAREFNKEAIREETLRRFSPEEIARELTRIYEEAILVHGVS